MPLLRQTAKKVRIYDLMNGRWVKKEGMEPSFVTTPYGEDVARARILATVVAKFISEDGNFGSITLDDGTDTMRAKCFKELKPLERAEIGDLVDLIGKAREYNGEIYLIPEIILKVQDPNWGLLRKLELIRKLRGFKTGKAPKGEAKEWQIQGDGVSTTAKGTRDFSAGSALRDADISASRAKGETQIPQAGEAPEAGEENSELRRRILKMIESRPEGLEFSEIIKKAKVPEGQVEAILNDILSEGICYEPTPGRIRKI